MSMETEINRLTIKLVDKCKKEQAGVVIGAAFNLAQTAMNTIADKRVLKAVAATLRDQANMIDQMCSEVRQ